MEPWFSKGCRWAGLLLLLTACGGDDRVQLGPDFECRERPDDAIGYLQPICRHVVENFDSYRIDPNDLNVERIEADGDQDRVVLSCCFTGDVAVMDRASKEVVSFSLGAR